MCALGTGCQTCALPIFRNHDGGEVSACGNGTRCVAALVMGELGRNAIIIETAAGLLQAKDAGPGQVSVDMGRSEERRGGTEGGKKWWCRGTQHSYTKN